MKTITYSIITLATIFCGTSCTARMGLTANNENLIGGHEYVDLGLPSGKLWATCNVGATKETELGDLFAWGETKPKKEFTWITYKWSKGNNSMTKYCSNSKFGTVDGKEVLEAKDDAATTNWGRKWRTPTYEELEELRKGCTWKWVNNYNGSGTNGGLGTSKVNGSNIFLPAAGFGDETGLTLIGNNGGFWSVANGGKENSEAAPAMHFDEDGFGWGATDRYNGISVRAVVK